MINAVVYESNTGFTKRYAEILSAKINVPAYDRKTAKEKCAKGESNIYMGWLMAGAVKGYKKANKRYSIKAVCAVGMASPTAQYTKETAEQNHIKNAAVFYLQGGYNSSKLRGIYKLMMGTMGKVIGKKLEGKENITEEERIMLDMMKNGGDYVSEDKLLPVISWVNSSK